MSIQDDIKNNLLVQVRAQLFNAAQGVSERAKTFEALFQNDGAARVDGNDEEQLKAEAIKIAEDLTFLVDAAVKLGDGKLPF